MHQRIWISAAVATVALAVACGHNSSTPVTPTSVTPGESSAAPDGSTLKATQPVAQSPVNGAQPEGALVLTATASTGKFTTIALSHRFEIYDASKAKVCDSGLVAASGNTVSYTVSGCALAFDAPHTWRVRAEYQGSVGPWSTDASFRSPVGGYIRGNELFDPLTNGPSSLISAGRNVTWIPGKGVQLNGQDSYVEWRLQQTCTDCEYSALITNLGNGSEEWKTKVMSMLQGDGVNVTDNNYRLTLDKRTQWVGQQSVIRYTLRSRGVDAGEPKSGPQSWNRANTYFWKYTWSGGNANLVVKDGGVNGSIKAILPTTYKAPYSPNPHLIRLGSVGGRGGDDTNPGTIVWNVWVSPNPRPNLPGDR